MDSSIIGSGSQKMKSFWERPEGTTGMIFSVLLLFGLGYLGFIFLPFIITLLQNIITAALLFAVVGFLIFLVTNKRVRTLASFLFKSAMRSVTSIFITIDPIGCLKNFYDELTDKIDDIDGNLGKLNGQLERVENIIEQQNNEIKDALIKAQVVKSSGDNKELTRIARQIDRLKDSNNKLQPLFDKMSNLQKILVKMREASDTVRLDIKDEIDLKVREKKIVDASYGAYKSALSILKGSDAQELYDEAMEFLADEYGRKVGEIKNFLETSDSIIKNVDLNNAVSSEKLIRQLDEMESRSSGIIDYKRPIPQQIQDQSVTMTQFFVVEETSKQQSNKYNL